MTVKNERGEENSTENYYWERHRYYKLRETTKNSMAGTRCAEGRG